MDNQDQDLTGTERRAKQVFDASVDALDAPSSASLAAARREAVDAVRRPDRVAWRTWAPAAAMAVAALVAVLLWRSPAPESAAGVEATLDPVELLAAGEDFDLVENDLAFYEWLDATGFDTAGSSG